MLLVMTCLIVETKSPLLVISDILIYVAVPPLRISTSPCSILSVAGQKLPGAAQAIRKSATAGLVAPLRPCSQILQGANRYSHETGKKLTETFSVLNEYLRC